MYINIICIYICMYVLETLKKKCSSVCIYILTYACMYACMYVYYAPSEALICIQIFLLYVNKNTCLFLHVDTYIHM